MKFDLGDTIVQREDINGIFEGAYAPLSQTLCDRYHIEGERDTIEKGGDKFLFMIHDAIKPFKELSPN